MMLFNPIILTIYYYNFIVILLCDMGFHNKHTKYYMFHRLLHFLPAMKFCVILRMVYPVRNMEQIGVEKLYVGF